MATQAEFKMHPGMTIGTIFLNVSNLDATLSFYVKELGLKAVRQSNGVVLLGADEKASEPLIVLKHTPGALTSPKDSAGLYHYAILLPKRKYLAAAYLKLGNAGLVFDGYADHLVSEALYLQDPEGNGIEIYADRPRDKWPHDEDGDLRMGTDPLDVDSLLKEVAGQALQNLIAIPAGARIGHIHLKVTEIQRSANFYHTALGLDLMSYWGSAAFLSAAGYHHHIGINTWESHSGQRFKDGHTGLDHFTIAIPDADFVSEMNGRLKDYTSIESMASDQPVFSDPDGIRFQVETATR